MNVHAHTNTFTHKYTCSHTNTQIYMLTHRNINIHAHTSTHTHKQAQKPTYTHKHTCTHRYITRSTQTCTHTKTHTECFSRNQTSQKDRPHLMTFSYPLSVLTLPLPHPAGGLLRLSTLRLVGEIK